MKGKVVLVTGSSAGIGEAAVLKFAELDCKVVVHGTDTIRISQVAQKCLEISPSKYKPLEVAADLRDDKQVENLLEATIKSHGQLHVLVNNAGFFQPANIDDVGAYKIYSDMIKLNLDSVVYLTTLAIPHLKKTKGCIVNVSSNLHAKCINGGFAYCTAKAGLTMFTKSIAVDLAPNVRVNSVSPGPIATLLPSRCGMDIGTYRKVVKEACLVGRVGEPEEVARVILFLASPESSFMTGSDVVIDGGSTIKPAGPVVGQENQ